MTTDRAAGETPAIPIEAVADYPRPGTAVPGSLAWSPDDRLISFLWSAERSLDRQLYAYDPAARTRTLLVAPSPVDEGELSLEEQLRRERQRQRELGVTRYTWAEQGVRLLVPLNDGLYVQDGPDAPLRLVVSVEAGAVLDPQLSPDGSLIAFVRDDELYVVDAAGGEPRQLTRGARGTGRTHGLAEYIAQEEMDRAHGFWWSPDGRRIAYTEVDETHIPVYRIMHLGKAGTGDEAQEDHRYPFAGAANARVRLAVIAVGGGEPVWLDLGDSEYLARVDWLPDGALAAQLENREQTRLELVRFDLATGERRLLLAETSPVWINLHDMFLPLQHGSGDEAGGFIWGSERSGFRHLYLYGAGGQLLRALAGGDWMVDELVAVDEARRLVYFVATRDGPTERHLYVVDMDGGEPRRLTAAPGTHHVVVDHARRRFVDTYQSLRTPPLVELRSLHDGALLDTIFDAPDPRVAELALEPPELVTIQSRDGVPLHGALYRPPARFGGGPWPVVVYVYGGPHAQLVTDSWALSVAMQQQYLRSLGFLVWTLDNRGSARRGLAFEAPIKHDLGNIEVQDQVDGVEWLIEQGLAVPGRVGIFGWSYGGYMAAMCLARAPETFAVGVAGAPVTDMDGYDTHYTERYMGTPQTNPAGYRSSSVLEHVANLTGKLMLVHGLIDENVHFRHTARLINALIAARKPYELLLFPDERHMPRGRADRIYMEQRISDFFVQHV